MKGYDNNVKKQEFINFRNEVNEALKEISNKYNIDLKAGNITYTNNSFTCKLEAKAKEIDGKSYEQIEFEKYCMIYNLKPTDYNKLIQYCGNTYILVGFKPRSGKYPILAKKDDGKLISYQRIF